MEDGRYVVIDVPDADGEQAAAKLFGEKIEMLYEDYTVVGMYRRRSGMVRVVLRGRAPEQP